MAQVRILPSSAILRNYAHHVPTAHALFRGAELHPLGSLSLDRPVLDAGCGHGEFASLACNAWLDVGVDSNGAAVRSTKRQGGYHRVVEADLCSLPFANATFRTVTCISVLEHVAEPALAIRELRRVLRPGGVLVATIVLSTLSEMLLGKRACDWMGFPLAATVYARIVDRVFGHRSMLPRETWLRIFRDAGFSLDFVEDTVDRRTLELWELLLPMALPGRILRGCGVGGLPSVRLPVNVVARLAQAPGTDYDHGPHACLSVVARNPIRVCRTAKLSHDRWNFRKVVPEPSAAVRG